MSSRSLKDRLRRLKQRGLAVAGSGSRWEARSHPGTIGIDEGHYRPRLRGTLGVVDGVRALLAALVAAALAAGCAASVPSPNAAQPDPGLPARLVAATTGDGAYRHLEELQRIADTHGGNRAAGRPGFDASAYYVAEVLRAAGFDVSVPEVVVRSYTAGNERLTVGGTLVAARALALSPTAPDGVSGPLVVLDQDATSGCEAADHTDRSRGAVVLIRRGTCPFGQKVQIAADAGAVAVVVANSEDGPLTRATLGAPGTVPALGVSRADGDLLTQRAGAPTTVGLTARTEEIRTHNVVAQTRTGNRATVVAAGAHLDSVPEGPGINDNGSGSAALLEIAVRLGSSPPVANAVRLAWWGGEETGLNGSTAYLAGLPEPERRALALYLNADMIASPNAGYFVHDADDSDREGAGPAPAGSGAIEQKLLGFLASVGIAAQGTDLDGRSDYAAFLAAGIPVGGIFTGAQERKSAEQARTWGGQAGAPFDPCYHQACDRIDRIDRAALDRNTDALADTLATYALSTTGLRS
jgi:Zn-dependent M28 family amino/carboxypeptidase